VHKLCKCLWDQGPIGRGNFSRLGGGNKNYSSKRVEEKNDMVITQQFRSKMKSASDVLLIPYEA